LEIFLNVIILILILASIFFGRPLALLVRLHRLFLNRLKWNNPITEVEFKAIDMVLIGFNGFYARLSENGKAKFIHRVLFYCNNWTWEGRDGVVIDAKIKWKIASAAAQLTFGFRDYSIDFIKTIVIYPNTFYSGLLKAYAKGITYGFNGFVAFSLKDFEEGYLYGDDRYNLGLHEMSHAIKLNNQLKKSEDATWQTHFIKWLKENKPEIERIKHGSHFLRDYAGTNFGEFFAVCTEHFYEVPEAFKEELPHTYFGLCLLYNINPLNQNYDYQLNRKEASINLKNAQIISLTDDLNNKITKQPSNLMPLFQFFCVVGFISFFFVYFAFTPQIQKSVHLWTLAFPSSLIALLQLKKTKLVKTEDDLATLRVSSFFFFPLIFAQFWLVTSYAIRSDTKTDRLNVVFVEDEGWETEKADSDYPAYFYELGRGSEIIYQFKGYEPSLEISWSKGFLGNYILLSRKLHLQEKNIDLDFDL
jgi:Mlc titration factor MtfA (ptsG expression regulator)